MNSRRYASKKTSIADAGVLLSDQMICITSVTEDDDDDDDDN